ncbi:hypothetical protein [Macrococcoides caseolyticum]|uniref:hypothetical protein n=1 Tax=Macrococcoides caseolyticum TaxID=69966 RepID=UPI0011A84AA0|nr:hypothetical protein [Macrococcus caseolyticus]
MNELIMSFLGSFTALFFTHGIKVLIDRKKELSVEDYRNELKRKEFFLNNYYSIYKDLYSKLNEVMDSIKNFNYANKKFEFVNSFAIDSVELTKEQKEAYMYGEDKELVFKVNYIYQLQLLSDRIIEAREFLTSNKLMLLNEEYEVSYLFIDNANKLMHSLREKSLKEDYKLSQEDLSSFMIEQNYLMIEFEMYFKNRFVII